MNALVEEFVEVRRWAVVGTSQDRHKFGNIILRRLHSAGYDVVGVHPDGVAIDDIPVYSSLSAIPTVPEVVNVVVPPSVTEQIVQECHELGVKRLWMQPGSQSPAAIDFCHLNEIAVISDGSCILVHHRDWPSD